MSPTFAVLFIPVAIVGLYMLRKKCKRRLWSPSVGAAHYDVPEVSNGHCNTNAHINRTKLEVPVVTVNHVNTTNCNSNNCNESNSNSDEESEDVAVCKLRTTIPLRLDRRPPCRPNSFTSVPVLDILFKVSPLHPPGPSNIPLPPSPPPIPLRQSSRRRSSFLDSSLTVGQTSMSRTKSSNSSQQYESMHTISEHEEEVIAVDEMASNTIPPLMELVPLHTLP